MERPPGSRLKALHQGLVKQPGPRNGQRGSMAITIMLVMLGLVAILGIVEVGYVYWAKRDAQKVADLAALAGAQRLDLCAANNADNNAARTNATDNKFISGQDGKTVDIACGFWNPSNNAVQDHFYAAPSPELVNAVKVVASHSAVPIFGQAFANGELVVSASAVAAQATPTASFSVGARLLGVNGEAPLQLLLKFVGLDLTGTQVLSVQGLADVTITPRGLLDAVGVGIGTDLTIGGLKGALEGRNITVGQLLKLYDVALVDQGGLLGLNLSFLQQAILTTGQPLGDITVNVLDILNLAAPGTDPSAGLNLDAKINALDLLSAAISVAGSGHAVAVDNLSLTPGITVKASIVEPASVGFGPVGATAYNAQIRLFVLIDSDNIPILGNLLKLTNSWIKLPLYVDAVSAEATLTDIDCGASPRTATFDVASKIAGICLGKTTAPWDSTQTDVSGMCADENVIRLLGNALNVNTSLGLPALQDLTEDFTVAEGQTRTTPSNTAKLGTTVDVLTTKLIDVLGDLVSGLFSNNTGSGSDKARSLAYAYLKATQSSAGTYDLTAAINAFQNGLTTSDVNLPGLGTWQTKIPNYDPILGINWGTKTGSVWDGVRTEICNPSLVGGLLQCVVGSLGQLLLGNINDSILNTFSKYLDTYPSGLEGLGSYDPVTDTGQCTSLLCVVLKPVISGVLRPILDGIGGLLSQILEQVLGLEIGRSDVYVQSIQCRSAQLVY